MGVCGLMYAQERSCGMMEKAEINNPLGPSASLRLDRTTSLYIFIPVYTLLKSLICDDGNARNRRVTGNSFFFKDFFFFLLTGFLLYVFTGFPSAGVSPT